MSTSSMVFVFLLSFWKVLVTSGKTFHVCKKDFFFLYLKPETVSQPLKAWKNNIPLLFSGPSCCETFETPNTKLKTKSLYDRSSSCSDVDSARKCLFLQKNTRFDNLPPTNAALIQHIKRATYQGGIVWGQTLQTQPLLPSPNQWGWMKNSDGSWGIHWTELNSISDECKELCKCSCKKDCSVRCSCRKTNLPCTSICNCPCIIDD